MKNKLNHDPDVSNPPEQDGEGTGGEEEFVVEKIIDKRGEGDETEYKVKWAGYPDEDNTWESAEKLECPELIEEFERNWNKVQEMMDSPRTPLLRRRSRRISSRQLNGISLETTAPLSTIADDPSTQQSAMMETVDLNDSVTITTDEVTASGDQAQK